MSRRETIASAFALITDTLFPLFCLGCDEEGLWLCKSCRKTLAAPGVFCCPVCHRTRPEGCRCAECAGETALDSHMALYKYSEASLPGRLIEAFKYQYLSEVVGEFRPLIQNFFSEYSWMLPGGPSVIAPVPLHPRRQAERGFNQARLIAEIAADVLGMPIADALKRRRYTRQQARLKREKRIKNVRGAFCLSGGEKAGKSGDKDVKIAGRNVILVDDVYTTGCTMRECARVLKAAGADIVVGFTLARG